MNGARNAGQAIFASLRHRDYRMLWLGNIMAGGSQWAMMVGRAWLVFDLSDSALSVAFVTFSAFFGSFIMVPLGGVLADRFDRRNLLIYSMLVPCLVNIVLAVITLTEVVMVWHVVALSFAANLTRSVGIPANRALIPNLVPKDDLLNAVALSNVALRGPRLVGPLMAAPLLATTGVEGVFIAAATFYALSALQLLRVRRPRQEPMGYTQGVLGNLAEGVRYLKQRPAVALLIALVAAHCGLTMSFDPLLPTFAEDELGAGGDVFSYIFMAVGAGGLAGTLMVGAVRGERPKGQLLLATGLLSGLTPMAMAFATTLPMAILSSAAMGASQATFMALTEAVIQAAVPDWVRGRVMGIYFMVAVGVMAWAALLNGYMADIWGAPTMFFVPGLLFLVVMVTSGAVRPSLRRVYRTGTVPAA